MAGGLCLGLFVTAVSIYFPSTIMPGLDKQVIPSLLIFALLVGFLILLKPEVGVLLMFGLNLFKPDLVQGLGLVTIIALVLSGILAATIAVRKQLSFLRAHQLQILLLIGMVVLVNWLFVGRIDAPSYLSSLDLTGRALERSVIHLVYMIFFVTFIRTPRQLLLLTGLFFFAILLTIPGAISHSATAAGTAVGAAVGKVEKIRAAATIGIQAAENANRLAFICLMGISLIWFALIEYRSKLLRILGGATILALVLTVFLSGSRSALVNLMLLPILLLGQGRLRPGRIAAVTLLLLLSISVSLLFVPERILQRITAFLPASESTVALKSVAESTERRLMILGLGLKMFGESPFMGAGVGNIRWLVAMDPASGGTPMTAHNAYLLALAEGGLILLGAYLLLFWVTFRDLGKALQLSSLAPEVRLRWLILATRTNLILLLVFSLFADAWKEFYYLLILATTAVLCHIYQRAAEQPWIRSRSSM